MDKSQIHQEIWIAKKLKKNVFGELMYSCTRKNNLTVRYVIEGTL